MLKVFDNEYAPHIALIFYGGGFELRIISSTERDELVKDFYDYFSEHRFQNGFLDA